MNVFTDAFDRLIGVEGKYSNDPSDSGGETMYGITVAVAQANGYLGPMRLMSLDTARSIYKTQYWDINRLDDVAQLSPRVAEEVFEAGVNSGTARAATWLQRGLNVLNDGQSRWPDLTADGQIGPLTVAVLKTALKRPQGELVILRALNALQGNHYITLAEARPKDERFVHGWIAHRVEI